LASRLPPRAGSAPGSRANRRRAASKPGKAREGTRSPNEFEEIAARAARLGITPERVLNEYAHIAFADLTHIVEWKRGGRLAIKAPEQIDGSDKAAISEIVGPGAASGTYRVKLYDKKAALDAIARYLGMFPQMLQRHEDEAPSGPAEDPREVLKRRLARLAAGLAAKQANRRSGPGSGEDPDP
jgi:hypothetical protein